MKIEWFKPWRASGLAIYDSRGELVAHTGITGNRSMPGEQLELMAEMIAEAVNTAHEPIPLHGDECKCKNCTIFFNTEGNAGDKG